MNSCLKNFCSLARFSPCAFLIISTSNAYPQAGALDSSFVSPFTEALVLNRSSRVLAELADRSVLVGFAYYSTPRASDVYLAHLNTNGAIISTNVPFPGVFTEDARGVSVVSVLNDGNVLVGGIFTLGTNAGVSTLTRLNSDLSWNTNFDHVEIDGRLTCLAVQNDGRILVGGQFSQVQGVARTNIARLNADGSIDMSFVAAEIGGLRQFHQPRIDGIAIQSNRVVIAGEFGSVGGHPRWSIARLHADGSHDETFDPAAMFGHRGGVQNAQSVSIDAAGRVLICGQFGRMDDQARIHVARLLPNGALDLSFNAPISDNSVVVHRVFEEPSGQIVIAGGFTTIGTVARADVARLNSDGSVDTSFDAGQIEDAVTPLIRLQDGKYLVGGQITSINGVSRPVVARLLGDTNLAPGTIQFLASNFRLVEDASRPGQVFVTRADGRYGAVSVDFSTRALSATTNDFRMTNGTVHFAHGEFAPKAIDLEIIDDAWKERTEEFVVELENPQGGAVLGQPSSARVRINENDYAGSVDTSFAPGVTVRGPAEFSFVNALLLQPDGRLVIGGRFTPGDGTNRNHLTRLKSTGSSDSTFAPGNGPNGEVTALAAQPDGRIFVAGEFTIFNVTIANRLVRLEPNGAIDQSFSVGGGVDGPILVIAAEPGGNVLIGGEFESVNGVNRKGLARLNSSGALQPLDVQLTGDGYAYVEAITLLPNGGAYIGGLFERAGGLPRNGLFRLLPNGSVDPNFRAATVTNQFDVDGDYTFYVYCVVPLPDGKILVGGDFYEVAGETRHGIVCLNEDGSLDRAFVPEFDDDSYIVSIARLPNGQLYAGGSFDLPTLPFWVDGVVRLNANGRIDWSFEPAFIDGLFNTMLLHPNGQIILAGYFDECAEMPRHNLARLNVETIPLLAIERVGGASVRVSWPEALGDLGLERADRVDGIFVESGPAIPFGGRYNQTNLVETGQRFYRATATP